MSERQDQEDRAGLNLIEAGLDELFAGRENVAPAPPSIATKRPASPNQNKLWGGLAAAAVVLMVVGSFAWSVGKEPITSKPNSGAATTVDVDGGTGIPLTPLRSRSEIETLDVDLIGVDVRVNEFDDAALAALVRRCPQLEALRLRDGRVTDAGLGVLRDLSQLSELRLPECRYLTDASLPTFNALAGLRVLDLRGYRGQLELSGEALPESEMPYSKFTGEGLGTLGQHPSLESLNLSGTMLHDAGLANLAASTATLRKIDLSGTAVSPYGLERLASVASLEEILFMDSGRIDDGLVIALAKIPGLVRLSIGAHGFTQAEVTNAGVDALVRANRLESLVLTRCPKITSEGYGRLGQMTSLRRLQVTGQSSFEVASLRRLATHSGLVALDLSRNHSFLEVEHVRALASGFTGLRELRLPEFPAKRDVKETLSALASARKGTLRILDTRGRLFPTSFARIVLMPTAGARNTMANQLGMAVVAVLDNEGREVVDVARGLGSPRDVLDAKEWWALDHEGMVVFETGHLDPGDYRLEISVQGQAPRKEILAIDEEGATRVDFEFGIGRTQGANWATRPLNLNLKTPQTLRWGDVVVTVWEDDGVVMPMIAEELRDCEETGVRLRSVREMRFGRPVSIRIYRRDHPVQVERLASVPNDRQPVVIALQEVDSKKN